MGPIWGWQDPGGPNVGPVNFVIWDHSWTVRMRYGATNVTSILSIAAAMSYTVSHYHLSCYVIHLDEIHFATFCKFLLYHVPSIWWNDMLCLPYRHLAIKKADHKPWATVEILCIIRKSEDINWLALLWNVTFPVPVKTENLSYASLEGEVWLYNIIQELQILYHNWICWPWKIIISDISVGALISNRCPYIFFHHTCTACMFHIHVCVCA